MHNLRLTTKLVLAIILAGLFGAGTMLTYYFQNKSQNRIESAFKKDIAINTELTKLRGQLRNHYYFVSLYINTDNPRWLDSIKTSETNIQTLLEDVEKLLTFTERKNLFYELKLLIGKQLGEERALIGANAALGNRRLVRDHPEQRKAKYDAVIEILGSLGDLDTVEMRRWKTATERKNFMAMLAIIAVGLFFCGVLGVFLYFYVIKPVIHFQEDAQAWQLGQTWQYRQVHASPEMQNLYRLMGELTEKLNKEYRNKCELAKFKTQLVSMVGHEFNNSLSIIGVAASLLKEKDANRAASEELYRIIEGHNRILGVSVRNLMNMGRLESGKLAIDLQKIVIDQVIKESVGLLELLWREKQTAIELRFPNHPMVVLGDQNALSLVITNLISNAIKYTPKGGRVEIGINEASGEAEIYVKDTGIGIAQEDQSKILAGFYRTENGRHMAKGFGVGLMLVSIILEGHGSRLEVESELGKGSEFFFKLSVPKSVDRGNHE